MNTRRSIANVYTLSILTYIGNQLPDWTRPELRCETRSTRGENPTIRNRHSPQTGNKHPKPSSPVLHAIKFAVAGSMLMSGILDLFGAPLQRYFDAGSHIQTEECPRSGTLPGRQFLVLTSTFIPKFITQFIFLAPLCRKGFEGADQGTLWRVWRIHRSHRRASVASGLEVRIGQFLMIQRCISQRQYRPAIDQLTLPVWCAPFGQEFVRSPL